MFASTQADKKKAAEVSAAVRDALENGQFSSTLAMVLGRGRHENVRQAPNAQRVEKSENLSPPPGTAAAQPHPADLAKSLASLEKSLATEIASGKIDVSLERRGLVISMRESALFASGDDAIAPGSLPSIFKIAGEIRTLTNPLRLEGHTDSIPIHNSRFRSNWELSAARAIAVMDVLGQHFEIPSERMSVAGYAENAPADTNDTAAGRAHNRRVDLVVLSAEAELTEPKAAPASHEPNPGPPKTAAEK